MPGITNTKEKMPKIEGERMKIRKLGSWDVKVKFEELKMHIKDIIEDSRNPILPTEVALEKYAESLFGFFKETTPTTKK